MLRSFPVHLRFLIRIFGGCMFFFTLLRLVLLGLNHKLAANIPVGELAYGLFNRGLLFDSLISCYLLAIPFLLLSGVYLTGGKYRYTQKFLVGPLLVFSIPVVSICISDIPYFSYYNSRITRDVLSWTENFSEMIVVTFTNPLYVVCFILFLAFEFLLYRILRKEAFLLGSESIPKQGILKRIGVFVISAFLLFIGIRGDFDFSSKPLLPEDAFRSKYPFANQIGLNATFSFLHSFKEYTIKPFQDDEAIRRVRSAMGLAEKSYRAEAPLFREVIPRDEAVYPNIVLVLMESMSAWKMGPQGDQKSLTPHLDELAAAGFYMPEVYSAGKHTFNGIFSTLYGFPALPNNKPTSSTATASLPFTGLPSITHEKGYWNAYFCTGKRVFDNIGSFLPSNGFDQVYDQENYPANDRINGWGVPDHVLFDQGILRLDSIHRAGKKFFSVFMTISTHPPYDVPGGTSFKTAITDPVDRSYAYADFAIGRFMEEARKKAWFEHTVFLFIGDHGQNFEPTYEMPLSYHQVPLIMYAPKLIKAQVQQGLGMQIDVGPTLLGMLNWEYRNNTMGIDLLKNQRPFVFFSDDQRTGVLSDSLYLISKPMESGKLFRYRQKQLDDCLARESVVADRMKAYAYAHLQAYQYCIRKRLTAYPVK